ncbi:MAG: hypothetical protein LBR26_14685 [Prevotella sp.]|jgi:hypothetical protein|nr:hypothetical protein [Prevotella sp.]
MKEIISNGLLWDTRNIVLDSNNLIDWYAGMNASTDGHRLPTKDEWQDLAALGSTWDDERPGRWFGPDHELRENSSQSVFLPADGFCGMDGTLYKIGIYGCYWSASPYSSLAYCLYFYRGGTYPAYYTNRRYGFNIRMVQDSLQAKPQICGMKY